MNPSTRARSAREDRDIPSRGLALVTVLWVLVLLSLVAASFTRTIRIEINLTRNLIDNAEAEALADAGVYRAIHELLSPQSEGLLSPQIENLLTLSSEPAAIRRRVERDLRSELGETFFPEAGDPFVDGWRTDGTPYVWPFGGGQVWVSIQDEAGKIDLNAAPDELLRGLFLSAEWSGPDGETVGLDEREADALVDAIVDFRDEDDLHRLQGAEDRDYANAGLPWGAKDAPFEAVEELQQVLGMTPPLYRAVAPALTVHSGSKGIDTTSAPRAVLLALPGSDAAAVDAHLAARAAAPEDTGPNFLGAEGFTARSGERVFTIHAEARAQSGAVFVRETVVELIGRRHKLLPNSKELFRFLAWKQGSRAMTYEPEPLDQ